MSDPAKSEPEWPQPDSLTSSAAPLNHPALHFTPNPLPLTPQSSSLQEYQ